jgi:hypothetical protein
MNNAPRSSRFVAGCWLSGSLLALATIMLWFRHYLRLDPPAQLTTCETVTARGLDACLVLGAAGLAGVAPWIWNRLGARRLGLVAVVGLAAWLACGLGARTHRIFFDEQIYMQIGQTYAHTGRLAAASYARAEHGKFEYYNGELNKQPQGWPYVYGQFARWFGTSPRLGQELNRASVALTASLLCLALLLGPWRLPSAAPPLAGLAWALTPMVPFWGMTAAVEPSAAASMVGVFAAGVIYIGCRDKQTIQGQPAAGALLAATTAFATYFRPESLMAFPLVVAMLWSDEDDFVKDVVAWGALAFALALVAPNLAQLWTMREQDWGATDGQRIKLAILGLNLASNGGYFFQGRDFPISATALALIGAAWLLIRARSLALVLAAWFIPAWGVFLIFYAGGYYYGASNRYAVISAAPVAVVAGIGLAAFAAWCLRRPAWLGLAGGLLVIGWAPAMSFVPYWGREAVEVQEEVDFVAEQARKLPSGSLIISQVPSLWLINGRNSAAWPNVRDLAVGRLRELANQFPGGIFMHYGFWEHAEVDRADAAARALVNFDAQEIVRYTSHAMTFAIYRLDTPSALERFGGPVPRDTERRPGELENALARAHALAADVAAKLPPAPAAP